MNSGELGGASTRGFVAGMEAGRIALSAGMTPSGRVAYRTTSRGVCKLDISLGKRASDRASCRMEKARRVDTRGGGQTCGNLTVKGKCLDNGDGFRWQPRRGGLREGGRDRDVLKVVVRAPPRREKTRRT